MDYRFRLARQTDQALLLQLYREISPTPGCTWDESYPALEDITQDIALNSLYCMEDTSGQVICAASAGPFDELAHLCWDARAAKPCELARIGVHPSVQRCGVGTALLRQVIADCRDRGFDCMRLLVSKSNPRALALYSKLGFNPCGEAFMYGHDFYCYEMLFIS